MRLRSAEEGSFALGEIAALARLSDGRVVYWDDDYHELRLHAAGGDLLRLLGREGEGPGEFESVRGLAVTSEDLIVVWDPGNNRVTVLDEDGRVLQTRGVDTGFNEGPHFALISDSVVSVMHGDHSRDAGLGEGQPAKLVAHSLFGPMDHGLMPLPLPRNSHRAFRIGRYINFPVRTESDIGKGGRIAIGRNESYSIEYLVGDRLLRISRDGPSVRVVEDERENWRRALVGLEQMTGEEFPVPSTKPYFRRLIVGNQGRLWVERYVPGVRLHSNCLGRTPLCWVEPITFDVFGFDGQYNGTVVLPSPRTSLLSIDGAEIWVAERGIWDEHELVRYRLLEGAE